MRENVQMRCFIVLGRIESIEMDCDIKRENGIM